MVGVAPVDGFARFTFGNHALDGGFSLVPTLVGMFAIPEIVKSARERTLPRSFLFPRENIAAVWLLLKEMFARQKFSALCAIEQHRYLARIGGGTSNILA
jgi:putative tricarboxylic transport membrane protein